MNHKCITIDDAIPLLGWKRFLNFILIFEIMENFHVFSKKTTVGGHTGGPVEARN